MQMKVDLVDQHDGFNVGRFRLLCDVRILFTPCMTEVSQPGNAGAEPIGKIDGGHRLVLNSETRCSDPKLEAQVIRKQLLE